ncbi:hypothetical protein MMC18_002667 [Xylographa bjoerkii]|nr:hypothetical protein [Xylographa bjoerkii]
MATTNDPKMAGRGLKRPPEDSDNSDWEYEYHATETESFFVTLDLPSTPSTKKRKWTEKSTDIPSTPNNASTQTPDPESAPPGPSTSRADLTASPQPENRIQILGLHTSEPVISYQNQVYTCQWSSTIGTDILLAPPDPAPPFPPVYQAPGFNVLATTNIKLVGEPVQLIPRSLPPPPPPAAAAAAVSTFTATAQPSGIKSPVINHVTPRTDTPHIPVTINSTIAFESPYVTKPTTIAQPNSQPPLAPPATPTRLASSTRLAPSAGMSSIRQSQGRFLERLVALKAARGEQDEVLLHHRRRPDDSDWKTWTDGGGRARQRRMSAGVEGEEDWEEDDSEGTGEGDEEALEGSDEDEGMGEGTVDGTAGVSGAGEAVATAEHEDTVMQNVPR